MINNYLDVLEESLDRKLEVLDRILESSREQGQVLSDPELSLERFDETVDAKDGLVEELNKLDEGFETLYDKVREELIAHRDAYREQIGRLQRKISVITDKSVEIQAQEARNKRLAEQYFAGQREAVRSGRKSSKAAFDYYKNMSGNKIVPPQFMDKKK